MAEQVNIRGIDERVLREIRAEAARRGVTTGGLINQILTDWLTDPRRKPSAIDLLNAERRQARSR